jgi:dTDP-glucose 4,6-dehydratase
VLNVDIIHPYFVDEPVDFVYHLASPASPIDYLRIPLHTLKVGSYGTHNTLGLAKKHRARFLIASTSEVYGDPQVHPQPETYWGHVNPIGPRGVYDEAKRYAEALTMAYHRRRAWTRRSCGSSTRTARACARTTAARSRPSCARRSRPADHRVRRRQPDAVLLLRRDLIDGMIRLAESGYTSRSTSATRTSSRCSSSAETVIDVTGSKSEIVYEALPTDDPQVRQPDITLAKELLGWEPQVELREGLERTIEQAGHESLVGAHG